VYMCVRVCVCMCVCMGVCACVCMYIHDMSFDFCCGLLL